MFTNLGFAHIKTEGKEAQFGHKTGELDAVFLYENVLLVVEETTGASPFNHAKNKRLLAEQILASKSDFISWLAAEFPDHKDALNRYAPSRFKVFFLYISKTDMELDDHDEALLAPMKVVTPRADLLRQTRKDHPPIGEDGSVAIPRADLERHRRRQRQQ